MTGIKIQNVRVTSPESVPIHLKLLFISLVHTSFKDVDIGRPVHVGQ